MFITNQSEAVLFVLSLQILNESDLCDICCPNPDGDSLFRVLVSIKD